MDRKEAEKQKTLIAEKQISYVRLIVIAFGTITFFLIDTPYLHTSLAHFLLVLIWLYGLYIPLFKPYEKFPVFRASWFSYLTDSIFATLWIYATGGFYSPYHVIFYTSIIAVSFRFNLATTLFTSTLYTLCYFGLLICMDQLRDHETLSIVRMGFVFIIGFMTNLITSETLYQTEQKIQMQKLAEKARLNHETLQQKQAELSSLNERLQLQNDIFNHAEENSSVGSYSWHLSSNRLEYSDNLYKLLGCEPGEFEPSFEKYMDFIHPDDREGVLKNWNESLESKTIKTSYHRIITRNGILKYLRTTGKMAGQGDQALVIGTLQDITSDIELNDKLQEKNLELERSNNELASFNYIASHDLQEPVRKIRTFTRLILEKEQGTLSETSKNYVTRISSAAIRMQNLIDAFLNYSRMDNSQLIFEPTDLNELLDDVINNLGDALEEKHAVIERNGLPVLPVVPFQVQQLFINLISNAVKYSKKDRAPVIRIYAEKVPGREAGHPSAHHSTLYWKISVEDNGIGFEQKYAEKIFEVFQRLHNKEEYAGTGIGLAICRKIALSHKGFITANGTPGQGAVFSVFFPTL